MEAGLNASGVADGSAQHDSRLHVGKHLAGWLVACQTSPLQLQSCCVCLCWGVASQLLSQLAGSIV